jgi:hypothetical protein
VRDAAYLAVIAGIAVGVAAGVIGVNRWLDAAAVQVSLRASELGGSVAVWQVAAGEHVRVSFANDGDALYVCTLPGAPRLELNPRPGREQAARFALDTPGRHTLACAPLEATAAAAGPGEAGMGGPASLPAAIFDVR